MTLILNGGDRPITIDDILLDEIEEHFEDAVSSHAGCSPLVAAAPPMHFKSEHPLLYICKRFIGNCNSKITQKNKEP